MTQWIDIVARALSYSQGRALLVRQNSTLATDPVPVFGIAPIRVVSEQRVQAIAFGVIGREPMIVTIWNPLSRESQNLDSFATALDDYLMHAVAANRLPRVWVPHRAALEVIDILAWRYRTNRNADDALRRMGGQCRALLEESRYPGQQVVVVATDVLVAHVATGQAPSEDHHLESLLCWLEPQDGVDPRDEADRRALLPAAAMLERQVDDEVERLRRVAKKGGREATAARRRIEALLEQGARREWDMLVRAHSAFWRLGLQVDTQLTRLVDESFERIAYKLGVNPHPASGPHSLAKLLNDIEHAAQLVEDIDIRGDERVREEARRAGRVVGAEIVAVLQQRPGFKPCRLVMRTRQDVLRVRPGTSLKSLDGAVEGRVVAMRNDPSGGTLVELDVINGVRAARRHTVGTTADWTDTVTLDFRHKRGRIYQAMRLAAPPLVYGNTLAAGSPRNIPSANLAQIADQLRIS